MLGLRRITNMSWFNKKPVVKKKPSKKKPVPPEPKTESNTTVNTNIILGYN